MGLAYRHGQICYGYCFYVPQKGLLVGGVPKYGKEMLSHHHFLSQSSRGMHCHHRLLTWLEKRRWGAYIGVLGVDSSDQIGETMLLFIFVGYEDSISVERTLVDLKASFVGDAVAVSEGGCRSVMVSGHIMDGWNGKGAGGEGGNKLCGACN